MIIINNTYILTGNIQLKVLYKLMLNCLSVFSNKRFRKALSEK